VSSRLLHLLAVALMLSAGCGKEIGELCEDDSDCASDICIHADWPAATDSRQCSLTCDDGCPDGTVCVTGYCLLECTTGGTDPCPAQTACYGNFSACFATCSDDTMCGNNTCSSEQLCNGE